MSGPVSRPGKRSKHLGLVPSDVDSGPVNALDRLTIQAAAVLDLAAALDPLQGSSHLEPQLVLLHARIEAFTSAGLVDENWRDTLDGHGVALWNESSRLKRITEDETAAPTLWAAVLASMRHAAYKIILLGAPEALTVETRVNLLSLATKTTSALAAVQETHNADQLLAAGAALAAALAPARQSPFVARVVLAHYIVRIESSARAGNHTVAKWVMEQARELVTGLGAHEEEKLGRAALQVGTALISVAPGQAADLVGPEKAVQAGAAIEWLLWATELVEGHDGALAQNLQILILQGLAQAYLVMLPAQSQWIKAEAIINEILTLSPTTVLWRRLIRLMIARGGGHGEIMQAFVSCFKLMPPDEQEGLWLLAELHSLPEAERSFKLSIIGSLIGAAVDPTRRYLPDNLVTVTSDYGRGRGIFIGQLLLAATFLIEADDRIQLTRLLDTLAPVSNLIASTPAFVCATYIWRQGDKLYKGKKYEAAAEWYLLGAHPSLESLKSTTWDKSYRKAALCFVEVQLFDRAEQALQQCSRVDSAKTHFVRFYNAILQRHEARAIAAVGAVSSAPDFELKMLLWMAKTCHESGLQAPLNAVLSALLGLCKSSAPADVDILVLVRCLIRLEIARLSSGDGKRPEVVSALLLHLQAAVEVFTSLQPLPAAAAKDLVWLQKTAYNLCVRFSPDCPLDQLTQLYGATADLLQLSDPAAPETTSQMLLCRFAAISGHAQAVRNSSSPRAQGTSYDSLVLPQIEALSVILQQTSTSTEVKLQQDIQTGLHALQVEALVALGRWDQLSSVVQSFESDDLSVTVSTIKAIAEKVISAAHCPATVVSSILKRTLEILFDRKDLDSASLAAWLRAIILLHAGRGAWEEALGYAANALSLLRSQHITYPADELSWLVAFTWDTGLELFSASNIGPARQWCEIALDAAQFSDAALHSKLVGYYAQINTRATAEES